MGVDSMSRSETRFDGRTVVANPNPNPPPPKKEGPRPKPPPERIPPKPAKDAQETRKG